MRKGDKKRGTGMPDPIKDRTEHEAKRGVKRIPLQDLASAMPTPEDLDNYISYIMQESDRGAAVMAAALVEQALEDVIRAYLAAPEDGTAETWFRGINAPFRSFASKISLGRALAIYGEHMEGRLIVIKNVRNAFAHRMVPLDFTHPTLLEECLKLSPHPEKDKDKSRKVLFGASCVALARTLGLHAHHIGGRELTVTFP